GAHPLPLDRAWTAIQKSLRESKRRTSWTRTNEPYEDATFRFLESVLNDASFVADLDQVVASLVDPGRINSLAQVALRLLSPGVPDTYQGCELWDSSLVDPDNRRAVDYGKRAAALSAIDGVKVAEVWSEHRDEGWPKLALLRACLQLRRRHLDAFGHDSTYVPLTVNGEDAHRVIAFERGRRVVAVVPRLPRRGLPDSAVVTLPEGNWTNILTGDRHSGEASFAKLSGAFPLAVLELELDPVV
ncbi:MAG: (1-_4)-alpha-D-glucan 1-alpha-D-glucosylmutase, partial [Acidimicrobiaceae bacterium]